MSRSVKDYLAGINNYIFLPGLQREFVWKPVQIEKLFDSLIRDYPVSIITEWNVRANNINDSNSYQFLRDYITSNGRIPNEFDNDFRRYNQQTPDDTSPDFLIIDGQQRLNSLYIGICGSIAEYTGGRGHSREDISKWERKRLCLDLFGHPNFEDNGRGDYRFQFRRVEGFGKDANTGYKRASDGTNSLWVPIGEFWNDSSNENKGLVSDNKKRDIVIEYVDDAEMPENEPTRTALRDIAKDVASVLYNAVFKKELKNDSVDHDTATIPEIFQRLNTEGVNPKPHQILMSQLMSYWPYDGEYINPRKKVETWMEQFYQDFPEYEQEIDRKLFMRYSSYLVKKDLLDKDIQGLSTEDMDELREKWLSGGNSATHAQFEWFRSSLAHAFETIIGIGIRPKIMKKMHIFAFLGQFYYYNPDVELNEDHRNEVFRFLAQCLLLNESYSVLTIGNARSWMRYLHDRQGEYNEFPRSELLAHENLNPSREDIRLVVENASYSGKPGQRVFTNLNVAAILGLLDEVYTSRATHDIGDYDVDHIFPQSKAEEIEQAVGHEVNLDRIGNLQLLLHSLNSEEKRDMYPKKWFDSDKVSDAQVEEIKRVNQYPDTSLDPASAAEFINAREERLIDHLDEKHIK